MKNLFFFFWVLLISLNSTAQAKPFFCKWDFGVKITPDGNIQKVTSGKYSDLIFDWDGETIKVKYLSSNTVVEERIQVEMHDNLWSDRHFSFSKKNRILLSTEINSLHDSYPTQLYYYQCK